MMRLLVTGGAGFIGSGFVLEALRSGHEVTVLDALTYAGHSENLSEAKGSYEFVEGNICDRTLVAELLKNRRPHALIHFAAESHVDRSITGPGEFIQTNIVGTFSLLEEALGFWKSLSGSDREGFRFIQVSTDEVFGELGETGYFTEKSHYEPSSPYSASKAAGDHLARAWYRTYGLPTLVTNCSNNYGPRQFPEKLIPLMISHALTRKPLPVYGQGLNTRDWIHVEDHCRGILRTIEKGKVGETYCFGGNAERKNIDVVKSICTLLDELSPRTDGKKHESGIQYVADRPGHDWRYAIDSSKAEKELQFERLYDFEAGLRQTVQWYLNHRDWAETVLAHTVMKKKARPS